MNIFMAIVCAVLAIFFSWIFVTHWWPTFVIRLHKFFFKSSTASEETGTLRTPKLECVIEKVHVGKLTVTITTTDEKTYSNTYLGSAHESMKHMYDDDDVYTSRAIVEKSSYDIECAIRDDIKSGIVPVNSPMTMYIPIARVLTIEFKHGPYVVEVMTTKRKVIDSDSCNETSQSHDI